MRRPWNATTVSSVLATVPCCFPDDLFGNVDDSDFNTTSFFLGLCLIRRTIPLGNDTTTDDAAVIQVIKHGDGALVGNFPVEFLRSFRGSKTGYFHTKSRIVLEDFQDLVEFSVVLRFEIALAGIEVNFHQLIQQALIICRRSRRRLAFSSFFGYPEGRQREDLLSLDQFSFELAFIAFVVVVSACCNLEL